MGSVPSLCAIRDPISDRTRFGTNMRQRPWIRPAKPPGEFSEDRSRGPCPGLRSMDLPAGPEQVSRRSCRIRGSSRPDVGRGPLRRS